MVYVLVVLWISASTGKPLHAEVSGDPFTDPARCLQAQSGHLTRAQRGQIATYWCLADRERSSS